MIRLARPEDVNRLLEMYSDIWAASKRPETFDNACAMATLGKCYDQGMIGVYDHKGRAVGFLAGLYFPTFCSQVLSGVEVAWWVDPQHRNTGGSIKLVKFMEKIAKQKGVKYWNMASMQASEPDKVNNIYERLGYTHTETAYTKEL